MFFVILGDFIMKHNPAIKLSAVIACLVAMFSVGIVYLWSVFQKPVVETYSWTASAATLVSSAIIFMYVLGSLIGGAINDRKGPRFVVITGGILFCAGLLLTSFVPASAPWLIYITYGTICGIGVGFVYSAALNCALRWFPHRRGFATGMTVCAFGLSATVLAPLITSLINRFGLISCFRILACSFPVLAILAGIFVTPPSQEYLDSLHLPASQKNQRQYTPREAVRTVEFWAIALAFLFEPAAYMMIIPRVKTLAIARGMTEALATLTVSLTGVASALARLISAPISDRIGRAKTIWILTLLTLISSVCMIFASGWFYVLVVMLIVAGYAGPSGIFAPMITESFGAKYSGTNFGMAFMFLGVSAPLFTLISNVVSASGAETGNYTVSFIIAAAGCIVPLFMLPLYDVYGKKRREKEAAEK